jgi:hypothetical protein
MDIIKRAPVTTLSTAEAVVGFTLTFLATHHLIGSIDVSATTATIAPFVALALPAMFGAAKWALVSPYRKVRDALERDGALTDADVARFEAIVAHYTGSTLAPEDDALIEHPTDDIPDSATAGVPTA